jgi:phytoene dehydrogenase-like protein
MNRDRFDAAIVGGGHNGLVAATLLGRAGWSVLVLERRDGLGGAAVSQAPFAGVPARLSRYSYLVSLFPADLRRALGVDVELRPRPIASYTPWGDRGLLVSEDSVRTRASFDALTGEFDEFARLRAMLGSVAVRVFPTLTEPLRSRDDLRRLIDDELAWRALFEEPLSELLERTFRSELLRGIVLTDGLIGTFAPADDPQLNQNRCFLYHVIGNGTGRWDVPIGGMGAVTTALAERARAAGAELRTDAEVVAIATDGVEAEVSCADGPLVCARHVLAGVAPATLAQLLGTTPPGPPPEGSQLKLNMVLERLPALRDAVVAPGDAFAGTFRVNESYEQLQQAFDEAARGEIPRLPPSEMYCHSLTDPSILPAQVRERGGQTLTLFGLHMPARLFASDPARAKQEAVEATLRSVNSVLAEPIEACLWRTPEGEACIEALTPPELEAELGMPGGHIFHRPLGWPFAETDEDVGRWGTETEHPNVWLCGAGARRGGGVSGIPGHNAARAVLAAS